MSSVASFDVFLISIFTPSGPFSFSRLHHNPCTVTMQNGKGESLEKGIWAAVVISAVIVVLRIFAKVKIKRFAADDILMIFAQVC